MATRPRTGEKKKRDFLAAFKLVVGCELCGYSGHSCALDFDHFGSEKYFKPGQLNRTSWENIKTELAKCRVLCANCHRIETFGHHARVVV